MSKLANDMVNAGIGVVRMHDTAEAITRRVLSAAFRVAWEHFSEDGRAAIGTPWFRDVANTIEKTILAPWTDEQVTSLNEFQTMGFMHPFTCRVGSSHGPGYLLATTNGWQCTEKNCDYNQTWAHAFMVNGEWRNYRDAMKSALGEEPESL